MRLLLPLLFLTVLACTACDGLRILALFPLNGKSHWVMAEGLLTGLTKRGHQIDVVTHFLLKNPPANYKEISVDGILETVVNNMNASSLSSGLNQNMSYLVNIGGDRVCELLKLPQLQEVIHRNSKSPKYDVIIVEVRFSRKLSKLLQNILPSLNEVHLLINYWT
ncbi:uncharacterized protein LOC108628682 [Ceratina calcarata]|uniref:Uncharacterized protein LOC108628682 n=1 Tax=Ceratina calcarata TaxID=156304 RepID=A0AAJ7NAW9_9HYME|nr:uncharacterized protein LOC108628682 [Ceratina calcarata]XP_017886260.1 uncharacterized protein LOC108628682 [Ceratina calcarata]XP_026672448.1 uncharacterized protein LOC108628682 [Ceratina calcarata]